MTKKQIAAAVSAAVLSGAIWYFQDIWYSYAETKVREIVVAENRALIDKLDTNQKSINQANGKLIEQNTKIDSAIREQREIRQDLRAIIQILRRN